MLMIVHRTFPLASTLFALSTIAFTSSSCDGFDLLPRTGSDAGDEVIRATLHLEASGGENLPSSVQGVAVTIKDVLLRREDSGRWLVWTDGPQEMPLTEDPQSVDFQSMPLPEGRYDAIRIELSEAKIQSNGLWEKGLLPKRQFDFVGEIDFRSDADFSILMNVDNSLDRAANFDWELRPTIFAPVGFEAVDSADDPLPEE